MSRQRVHANSLAYTVSPDDDVAEAEQLWAVVIGRVIDEITGAAPRTLIRITTAEPGLATRVDADGAMCVIARPWLRFPPLEAEIYTVHLTVEADGYMPLDREILIPCNWRRLTLDASVNDNTLNLDAVSGLFAGQILWIGPGGKNAERHRIAEVEHVANVVTLTGNLIYSHLIVPAPPIPAAFVVPDAFTIVKHALVSVNAARDRLTLDSTIGLYVGQRLRVGASDPVVVTQIVSPIQVAVAPPLQQTPNVGAPVIPDLVIPVHLGDIQLRRRPVVIRGRTIVRTSIGTTSVPNATVNVVGLWRTLADVRTHAPAVAANMVSVKPGLYGRRIVATLVDEILLTPAAGEDKLLGAPVIAGDTRLPLSDRVNLVAGTSVLAIEPNDTDRLEQLLVSGLEPTLAATDPTMATVNFALQEAHAQDSRVVRMTPGAPVGASKHLMDEGILGDQTLFLDSIAFAGGGGMAQVDGGPTVEFQQFARFQVTSDAEGYYVLPPLHRVAQIEIEASAVGHPPINTANSKTIIFQPDYAVPENWLDVVFES